jgi:DNA-binding response OmpR family regulator
MDEPRSFLIVTADARHAQDLEKLLTTLANGQCTEVTSAEKALDEATHSACSAVFLNADDPKVPTEQLCQRLRKRLPVTRCAIILFGVKRQSSELVRLLDSGADDYWALPFRAPVCLAYLRAIFRRITRLKPAAKPLKSGNLSLDPTTRQVLLGPTAIALRSKEFDLLYYLLQHRGKALSRDALLRTVWGYEYFGTTRTVDFHVSQLRRKLGRLGQWIETVAGTGYRWNVLGSYKDLTGLSPKSG